MPRTARIRPKRVTGRRGERGVGSAIPEGSQEVTVPTRMTVITHHTAPPGGPPRDGRELTGGRRHTGREQALQRRESPGPHGGSTTPPGAQLVLMAWRQIPTGYQSDAGLRPPFLLEKRSFYLSWVLGIGTKLVYGKKVA